MITTNPINSHDSNFISPNHSNESSLIHDTCSVGDAPQISDLHNEISSLRTARQTDAYLLTLKEREIAELRSLLQSKTVAGSLESAGRADADLKTLRPPMGFSSYLNDSSETLVSSECNADIAPAACESPTPLATNQVEPFNYSDQQNIIGGVEMKRIGGIRFDSFEDQQFSEPQSSEFTERDLQSFQSLRLHTRKYIGSTVVLAAPSPSLPSDESREDSTGSPTSRTNESVGRRSAALSCLKSASETRCSSTSDISHQNNSIWTCSHLQSSYGQISGSTKPFGSLPRDLSNSDMHRQNSLGSLYGVDFQAYDPRNMTRNFAEYEIGRNKIHKAFIDSSSASYHAVKEFKPQQRTNSVPTYNQTVDLQQPTKQPWTIHHQSTKQSNIYPEFDDIVGESTLYSANDADLLRQNLCFGDSYNQSALLQNSLAGGRNALSAGIEVDEFGFVSCDFGDFGDASNYQLLVEKIIHTNDQPASLHLQQNIKNLSIIIQTTSTDPTTMQAAIRSRNALMDAVRPQALSLMRNRFGNFLMQRCLEFGTRDQVKGIITGMVGHMYPLSCDRFGCHVVQKALDVCEDDLKYTIISELFRAIPETITHRFACHVWQRVFETRWGIPLTPQSPAALEQFPLTSNMANSSALPVETTFLTPQLQQPSVISPAQVQATFANRSRIAVKVDAALKGQWHLVANDENGSLVVQCIFENCVDCDKREIVKEVLTYTAEIAKGQWGNWVIQHLLDHGTPADKSYIFKVVARNVYHMSVDQFASKVVEKVLKSCQRRELYDIVDVIISPILRDNGQPGLIEMMNNQYANYVVQHILTLSDPSQRDACVRIIAPHLSVLRSSKYGQRVAAIVEKHMRTCQQKFGTIMSASNLMGGLSGSSSGSGSHPGGSLNHFSRCGSNGSLGFGGSNVNSSLNSGLGAGYEEDYNNIVSPQSTSSLLSGTFTPNFNATHTVSNGYSSIGANASSTFESSYEQYLAQQQLQQQAPQRLLQNSYSTSPTFQEDSQFFVSPPPCNKSQQVLQQENYYARLHQPPLPPHQSSQQLQSVDIQEEGAPHYQQQQNSFFASSNGSANNW